VPAADDRFWRHYDGWNDTTAIKEDVERAFAKGAHVTVPTLRRALARIVADGYHGPIGDREWEAMDGARMDMRRALAIVRAAVKAPLPTIELFDPDVGYTCEGAENCDHPIHGETDDAGRMFHTEPVAVDSDVFVRWYFRELLNIYGTVDI